MIYLHQPGMVASQAKNIWAIWWERWDKPRHEKTCLWGLRPGKTQTGLLSYKDQQQSWNFWFSNYWYYTIHEASEQKRHWSDSAGWSAPLLCVYGISQGFSWCGSDNLASIEQVAQRARITHLSTMCQGQISFQKNQTHPSFNACSCYMKVSKGSNQKQQRKSGNTIFPIIRSIGVFLRHKGS